MDWLNIWKLRPAVYWTSHTLGYIWDWWLESERVLGWISQFFQYFVCFISSIFMTKILILSQSKIKVDKMNPYVAGWNKYSNLDDTTGFHNRVGRIVRTCRLSLSPGPGPSGLLQIRLSFHLRMHHQNQTGGQDGLHI